MFLIKTVCQILSKLIQKVLKKGASLIRGYKPQNWVIWACHSAINKRVRELVKGYFYTLFFLVVVFNWFNFNLVQSTSSWGLIEHWSKLDRTLKSSTITYRAGIVSTVWSINPLTCLIDSLGFLTLFKGSKLHCF